MVKSKQYYVLTFGTYTMFFYHVGTVYIKNSTLSLTLLLNGWFKYGTFSGLEKYQIQHFVICITIVD